jgi:DNA-binding NarL/FixJ family response regulator
LIVSRPLNAEVLLRYEVTPAQRRVLEVLVSGASDRQIAERLVLSVKTVESHLVSLRGKTLTASRGELMVLFTTAWSPARVNVLHTVADIDGGCF